ncbi:MAG TPA: PAS domain S-box protein [Rhizomicrobium sp.]|nr:PAS domain S-box protein [Rhizomicrobium sp.]
MDNNPVVIADAAGVIRFWSAGAAKAFGHASARAVGQTLDLIVPSEYRQAHWTGFRHAMASGTAAVEGKAVPFPVRRADGETLAARGRLTLLREPGGVVIAAVVVFENSPAIFDEQRP